MSAKGEASAPAGVRVMVQVKRIIMQQIGVTVVISLVLLAIYGTVVGVSAFVGGAIGFLTSWMYAWKMSVPAGSDPGAFLKAHYKAEGYKLGATFVLFAATFILFKGVAALPLFLTYGATLLAFWVALLLN